ncbi:single-stranded DNA-binding protein [Allohahella sp. A8]|uniref:single-stranded DNA-binding protein n=1 Tax=Allohahella sp. A8 TaxID=3141461 RepID=UPI003A8114A9
MSDFNSCTFSGRLGKDPEAKATQSGMIISGFSIACSRKYKGEESTEWLDMTAFGKLAEICNQYLKKGSKVLVRCRLQTDTWDKDGVKQYRTKFIVEELQMLDSKGDNSGSPEYSGRQEPQRQAAQPESALDPMDDFDSDVPF